MKKRNVTIRHCTEAKFNAIYAFYGGWFRRMFPLGHKFESDTWDRTPVTPDKPFTVVPLEKETPP